MASTDGVVHRPRPGNVVRKHAWTLRWLQLQLTVWAMRAVLRPLVRLGTLIEPALPRAIEREYIDVPSRDKGRTIRVGIYRPKQLQPGKRYPVAVNWHGSGFVLPCHGQDSLFCGRLCDRFQAIVLDADYRKAPEHPYPAAVEDAQDVVAWALSSPSSLPPLDLSRVALTGFSAGANLALVTGLRFGPSRVAAVSVLYPPTELHYDPQDIKEKTPPKDTFKYGMRLTKRLNITFRQAYIVPGTDDNVQDISPINADPKDWPHVVHITCGDGDRLWGDGDRLIKKLSAAAHPDATFNSVAEGGHGFDKVPRSPEARQARDDAYDVVFRAIERGFKHA